MDPDELPGHGGATGRSRQFGDFALQPERRAAAARTIPSTTATRPSRRRCSTPSAAARSSTRRTSRASTRRTSACGRSTASRRLAARLRAPGAVLRRQNARMMGVSGLAGDPAYPRRRTLPLPPLPLGKLGETLARGFNRLGWHWWPSDSAITTRALRGPRAVHQRRHVPPRLPAGREGAARTSPTGRRPSAVACASRRAAACARSRSVANGMADGVVYYDADGVERRQQRRGRGRRVQRHRHAAPAAQLALEALPRRPREPQRARRQEPDVPSVRDGDRRLRRAARGLQGRRPAAAS